MPKVLSQSGISLADTYDVEGSIAGIDRLLSEEVLLFHEMGGTLFSERFSTTVRRRSTGAIAQNITIGQIVSDLPSPYYRIFGFTVFNANNDSAARLTQLSIYGRDALANRETVLWRWNGAVVDETFNVEGAVSTVEILVPDVAFTVAPQLMAGITQPQSVSAIVIRGLTAGFGAGTVEIVTLMHIGFVAIGGLSSEGLPIPSW